MPDMTLVWILLATLVDSIVALIGIFTLWLSERFFRSLLFVLVAFSAGALLSGALFHLVAEALEGEMPPFNVFLMVIIGFSAFFLMEKFLYWRHCHNGQCTIHPFTYLILFGDSIHNFIDGLVIAASFVTSAKAGVLSTLIIISHEVPQELGDYAVLIYGGMRRKRALGYNFISQLTCVVGGVVGWLASSQIPSFRLSLLPLAAGGFIYIAASDLIPELHKEIELRRSVIAFVFFVVGVVFMLSMKLLLE